jgi:hypothetical protein
MSALRATGLAHGEARETKRSQRHAGNKQAVSAGMGPANATGTVLGSNGHVSITGGMRPVHVYRNKPNRQCKSYWTGEFTRDRETRPIDKDRGASYRARIVSAALRRLSR